MTSSSDTLEQPKECRTRCGQLRLLKNGAEAHEFTREDRARGGRARAEKVRRRNELRERFEVAELEDLAAGELELLNRALVRLGLLIASDDARVAWRACKEVLDRVLGRPQLAPSLQPQLAPSLFEYNYEEETKRAREKLAAKLEHMRAAGQET
jgi:hypothetical protein